MQQPDRPLSPHLQIYRPQLTTVLSILHRMTGAGLAAGGVMIAWLLFATISGGIPGGQMGAFAASMNGDDIWRIIVFLRDETRKRQAAGDEAVTQAR